MNYLHHPNLLVQFWASLNTEFDKILDNFVRGDGWLFQDLGVAAKKGNIGAIYRCVCTVVNSNQGKEERLDHFLRVNFMILDAAKTQWLVPWRNYVVDPKNGVIPPFMKRQVGGFFLLYMLYVNQPLPNRFHRKQKILMDPRDIISLHVFTTTLQRLPKKGDPQLRELARQVVVLYNDLVVSEAFAFGAVNDTFATTNQSVRLLLATKLCIFTKTIYTVKDLRDQLYYITHQESKKMFQSLITYGRSLPEERQRKPSMQNGTDKGTKSKGKHPGASSTFKNEDFHPTDKQWTVEEILSLENENDVGKLAHNVTCILNSLNLEPTFTRRRLTGISDNFLDRELENFVSTHQSYIKVLENNMGKHRAQKHANLSVDYGGRGKNPETALDALKRYFSGDYGWVDNIFNNQHQPINVHEVNHSAKETNLEEIIEEPSNNEENDEWMTDDDDDDCESLLTDAESLKMTPTKTRKEKLSCSPMKSRSSSELNVNLAQIKSEERSPPKSQSPRKRSRRVLSMPTIF